MLSDYLNQSAQYRPLAGRNNRSEPQYGDAVTVACRRRDTVQQVITSDGRSVKAQAVYYLTQPVALGDSLDGRPILLLQPMAGLSGDTEGYKATT